MFPESTQQLRMLFQQTFPTEGSIEALAVFGMFLQLIVFTN